MFQDSWAAWGAVHRGACESAQYVEKNTSLFFARTLSSPALWGVKSVYAIEQGVKKIGKANGLKVTEVGLLDFTIDTREHFLWWQAEPHHVKNVHCCPGAIGGALFESQLLE